MLNNPGNVVPVDKVIGIGSEPPQPERGGRAKVIVGVVGGLAIGLLLATGAQQGSPEPDATPDTLPAVEAPPAVSTTTITLAPSRLDILVDEYEGTLYLVGLVNQQSKLWRWESRTGTPLELAIPENHVGAAFNSSQIQMAVGTTSGFAPGLTLWVGTPGNIEPLAVDTGDARWHSSDPRRLAWVEFPRTDEVGTINLRTSVLPSGADEMIPIGAELAPLIDGANLVEYDDSGFLLQTITQEEGFLLLAIDNEGGEVGRMAARYLGPLPEGNLLLSQAGSLVRASRSLEFSSPYAFPSDSRMAAIAVSPTDDRWAIWEVEEPTGVAAPTDLWIVEDGDVIFETTLPSALRAASWSRDGRWLVTAVGEPSPLSGFSSGQLWFIDTEDWSMHAVDAPGFVFEIAAVP